MRNIIYRMDGFRDITLPLWARKTFVIVVLFLISSTVYVSINDYHAGKNGAILSTKIDELIPFNPHWVWPYYYYYGLLIIPIFLIKDREELRKGMFAYIVSGLITSAFFYFWCTEMIRPDVVGDTLAIRLVKGIYHRDHPYNCFPSQHVTYSFTAAFVMLQNNKAIGIVGLLAALTIAASTVLIKQHWFVDFPSGLAVAGFSYYLVYHTKFFEKKTG